MTNSRLDRAIDRVEFTDFDMALPAELHDLLIDELYTAMGRTFARYHPRFIVEHVGANANCNRGDPA